MKSKQQNEKGKIMLSKYFQEFKAGDRIGVVREPGLAASFPQKLEGRSGKIEQKRGSHYLVKINDFKREKTFIIHPVHLEKIENKKK